MAKSRVLLRILCSLLWLLGTANAAPSAKVVLLQGTTIEWEAGSRVLLAELEATGFTVLLRTTAASTPGQLIDELRVAGASEDCGAVVVFGEPPTPRAYVWLPEREDLVQVEAPFDAASVAPQVLALRVVELLRTRWALVAPKRKAPPPQQSRCLLRDQSPGSCLDLSFRSAAVGDRCSSPRAETCICGSTLCWS